MLNACHPKLQINLPNPLPTIILPFLRQRPLRYLHIYVLALLFVSPCCQLPCHSSRSVLASPCSAGSGVVCSPIHNNSSEEHLAVSFTLLTTRLQLLQMTPPFCIFQLPSSKPCKSWLKKLYVDLPSLLILLLILSLTLPLTLSLLPTQLPLTLYVFTPWSLPRYIRTHLPKILRITTLFHFSTLCLIYVYIPTPYSSSSMMPSDAYPRFISSTLAYPASWLVSVPIVLLFISFLLLRINPTGACPCLTEPSAVQHVSVLSNDFSHTFPYVVSFSLTPLLPLIPSLYLLYVFFFCF